MKEKIIKTSFKILAIVFSTLVVFSCILYFYFSSVSGQKTLSNLVVSTLSKKLNTPVLGQISYKFPDWIQIGNLLIKDKKGDTLVFSKKAYIAIKMWDAVDKKLNITDIHFENIFINVNRHSDKFNYQFILDTFKGDTLNVKNKGSFAYHLDKIKIHNLKLNYSDSKAGHKIFAFLKDASTGFEVLNPDKSVYKLNDIVAVGLDLKGEIGQNKKENSKPKNELDFMFRNLILNEVAWDFKIAQNAVKAKGVFLDIKPEVFDIKNTIFAFKKIKFSAQVFNYQQFPLARAIENQINFNNLGIEKLGVLLNNVKLSKDGFFGKLTTVHATEKNGWTLKSAESEISIVGNQVELKRLRVKVNNTQIFANLKLNVDSSNIENSVFKIELAESKIAVKDAFVFNQELNFNAFLKKLENENIFVEGKAEGNIKNILLNKFILKAPKTTQIHLKGIVSNLNDPIFNLKIVAFSTSKKDIYHLIPASKMPSNISFPDRMFFDGYLKGSMGSLYLNVNAKTEQGSVNTVAHIYNLGTSKTLKYTGKIDFKQFNTGFFIQKPELGQTSGSLAFDGSGLDSKSLKLNLNGKIDELNYQNKIYHAIEFNGLLNNQVFVAKLNIDDSSAQLKWDGKIDFSKPELAISGSSTIASVNLKELGFIRENIEVRGEMDIKEFKLDFKDPRVLVTGKNISIYKDDKLYPIGDLKIETSSEGDKSTIDLETSFMKFSAGGNFDYSQLKDVILTEINHYFNIPDYKPLISSKPYLFNVNGKIQYDPIFKAFLPDIHGFAPISVQTLLRSEGNIPILGKISIPYLLYDSIKIYNTSFDYFGDRQSLKYFLKSEQISNVSYRVRNATIDGKLEGNKADFSLAIKDSVDLNIHALHGYIQNIDNKIRLTFDASGSKLFYKSWSGNPNGYIDYSKDGFYINDVIFTSDKQIVRLNTINEKPNSPIKIFAQNLDLNSLSKAVKQDSIFISGFLDADVQIENYMDGPIAFFGDFKVNKFFLNQISLGEFSGNAKNEGVKGLSLRSNIKGENANIRLIGNYSSEKENALDLKIFADSVNSKVLEPYVDGILNEVTGNFSGEFAVKGSASKPDIGGFVVLPNFKFKLVETGAKMELINQKVIIKDQKILLQNIQLTDNFNSKLNLNGFLNIETLPNYSYTIDINSKDFNFIDSKSGDNDLFYGTGFFETDLKLKGKNLDFVLSGDVKIGSKTDITMLMPDDSQLPNELEPMVTFMNFKNPEKKIADIKPKNQSINFANTLNINVEVSDKAKLNILMDQVTGDLLTVKGEGKLNTGFDNKGSLYILGRFDIKEGSYNLTYQIINKKFIISDKSKSYISWSGDPLEANLFITAEHNLGKKSLANYPFQSEELKKLKPNIPLRVDLVLSGVLSQPKIDFELVLNETDIGASKDEFQKAGFKTIDDKGIKNESNINIAKSELIKDQSIMILMTGAFNFEDFGNKIESSKNYEDIARQKVSDLISSQLNKYAAGIIKGIDLDLGLQSGYNLANDSRNTNLSLGVKKKFAKDRLILSVGKNFELENKDLRSSEIFDNIQANFIITKDGRYRLNVFRKNLNQMVIEGSVIETGLGFVVAIDYETWKELMKKQ